LWSGTGLENPRNLFFQLTVPSALQAINQYALGICEIDQIVFEGAKLESAYRKFKQAFPELKSEFNTLPNIAFANTTLYVVDNDTQCQRLRDSLEFPGNIVNFEILLDCYRLSHSDIDLSY
jgi:hypothetical protein